MNNQKTYNFKEVLEFTEKFQCTFEVEGYFFNKDGFFDFFHVNIVETINDLIRREDWTLTSLRIEELKPHVYYIADGRPSTRFFITEDMVLCEVEDGREKAEISQLSYNVVKDMSFTLNIY